METKINETLIEGRNPVIEAIRAGKPIDKLYILDGCNDGPVMSIKREAKKKDIFVKYVAKERLDQLSETGKHQGVIAYTAAYEYSELEDIFELAQKKGEAPFVIILDNIEDPHNLGAVKNSQSCRCSWCDHTKEQGCRTYIYSSKDKRGSDKLYTGCESDKHCTHDRRTQKAGHVVCLCRYGWNSHVRS